MLRFRAPDGRELATAIANFATISGPASGQASRLDANRLRATMVGEIGDRITKLFAEDPGPTKFDLDA